MDLSGAVGIEPIAFASFSNIGTVRVQRSCTIIRLGAGGWQINLNSGVALGNYAIGINPGPPTVTSFSFVDGTPVIKFYNTFVNGGAGDFENSIIIWQVF